MTRQQLFRKTLSVVIGFILVLHGILFVFHRTAGAWASLSYAAIFPAAVVNGVPVSYHHLAAFTNGLEKNEVYEKHGDAFQAALTKSVNDAAVLSLARELKLPVGDIRKEADGTDPFARKYIEEPLLIAQRTEEAVLTDAELQADAKNRIGILRERFAEGMPFSDAAPRFSEDVTGGNGGELGTFLVDEMPTWLLPVKDLEVGEISGIIDGPDAFWLIEVAGKSEDENGATLIHLRGIAAKKRTLNDILEERLSNNPPWVFVW